MELCHGRPADIPEKFLPAVHHQPIIVHLENKDMEE